MLRSGAGRTKAAVGCVLMLIVGALCAVLVWKGNPGNMGICGACFLRDVAGSAHLAIEKSPRIFRPEILGLVFGAALAALAQRRFHARSGSFAGARFVLGIAMGFGALVFPGCPFRTLQRIGGGDVTAMVGFVGLAAGVFVAYQFEKRGYSVGKTAPAPMAVGVFPHVLLALLFVLFLKGGVLAGPGPGDAGEPKHAPWALALSIALVAGVLLSVTRFCAIGAVRQLFAPGTKAAFVALVLLVVGYGVVAATTGSFKLGATGQPAAHADWSWNILALMLVGLTGAFAGGCPVRQVVMAGEGNADAFVTVAGIAAGGALSHGFGIASSAAGPTPAGKAVVVGGIVFAIAYAAWVTYGRKPAPDA